MVDAQTWLDEKYKDKSEVEEINSERKPLEGDLVLEDFPKLEKVDLSEAKGITKLTIKNCPNIYYMNVNDNQISKIEGLEELKELQWLWVSDNKITDPNIIIRNERLFIFACVRNPIEDKKINGKLLNKLIFFGGGIGEGENTIFYSVEKEYGEKLKELAKELGIKDEELKDKKVSEIEETINDKAKELKKENELGKENLEKIKEEFPDLINKDSKITKFEESNEETKQKLKKQLVEKDQQIDKLKDEVEEAKNQNQSKLAELNTELNELTNKNSSLVSERIELKETIRELSGNIKGLKKELIDNQEKNCQLNKENDELTQQIVIYQKNLSEKEQKTQELERKKRELASLGEKITDLENREQVLQGQIKKLAQELDNTKNNEEKQRLKEQLVKKKEELAKVQGDLERSQKEMKKLRSIVNKSQSELENLGDKLDELNKELEIEKDRANNLAKEKQILEEKISRIWQKAKENLDDYISLMKDEIEGEDLDEEIKQPFKEKIAQLESFINNNDQKIEKEYEAKMIKPNRL